VAPHTVLSSIRAAGASFTNTDSLPCAISCGLLCLVQATVSFVARATGCFSTNTLPEPDATGPKAGDALSTTAETLLVTAEIRSPAANTASAPTAATASPPVTPTRNTAAAATAAATSAPATAPASAPRKLLCLMVLPGEVGGLP